MKDRRAGLTLAELMIALFIGGLTLVITAQGASNVRRWGARLHQAGQMDSQMSALYQFAQSVLSQSLPMSGKDQNDQRVILFEGSAHEVRFVRAEPGYPSRAGLYQYHLYGVQNNGDWSLVLERALLGQPEQFGDMQTPVRLSLFEGKQEPVFAFWSGGKWQDDWTMQPQAPVLASFAMGDWPALSISMNRAAAEAKGASGKTPAKPGEDALRPRRSDQNPGRPKP